VAVVALHRAGRATRRPVLVARWWWPSLAAAALAALAVFALRAEADPLRLAAGYPPATYAPLRAGRLQAADRAVQRPGLLAVRVSNRGPSTVVITGVMAGTDGLHVVGARSPSVVPC
jgi:hypothetical protein